MTGLEISDERSIAVSVDAEGRVQATARVDGAAPVSAPAALHGLKARPALPLCVASQIDRHDTIAETLAALMRELGLPPASNEPSAGGIGAVSTNVHVVGSGVAAAAAESWAGAARGATDVVYFAVRERPIAGIIRGGVPVGGAHGRAASAAWLALNPVEREDYRKVGCVEAEVAAAGVVRRLIWRIKAGDHSRVQDEVGGDLGAIMLDHVLAAARGGDGVAISVVRDTAKYLGMAAANMVAIEDPHTLVLGGIMATAHDLLFEPVKTEIVRRLPRAMADALVVVPAALGDEAAAIGAARLAAAVPS